MKLLTSRFLAFCFATLFATASFANLGDINVLKARESYDKENAAALNEYTNKLKAQHHILAPYAQYWLMTIKLEGTDNSAISSFLVQHEDYAFVQSLRGSLLRKLGRQKKWALFAQELALYQATNNIAVECLAAEAAHVRDSNASLIPSKHLWLTGQSQPRECDNLFDAMESTGVIDEDAVWQRFRMAAEENRLSLAKAIMKRSKHYKTSHQRLMSSAYKSPSTFLKKKHVSFSTRFGHEVNLFALTRLARKDTWTAINAYQKIASLLSRDEKSHFHAILGLFAAKRHEAEAKLWFQKTDVASLSPEQISWYARATLRQSDWRHLLTVIAKMQPEIAEEARWRYWKARALMALKRGANQQDKQAVDILTGLAHERHYYGWLAQDELVNYTPPKLAHYNATKREVVAIGNMPGVKRTAALLNLELRWESRGEWKKVIAAFNDKQLLAAAEFANLKGWNDLAINTADDTRGIHDFSLRYLMPYKKLMTNAANVQGVDVTWAYGVTRQESRFMHYAKSHVGAAGLMQLMPTTARWAAKRAGVENYKRSMIHDLETNVTIGTYYLRYTLALMDGNKIMATAGYNAGPSRAKKWLGVQSLEGAIYAETIPFDETRKYVQHVMANMHMYNQQLGIKGTTLKQIMGRTPAKAVS
jgi:soluble lytic murein transglycosylase